MKTGYSDSFIEMLVTSNIFAAFYTMSVCLITLFLTGHPFLVTLPFAAFSATLLIYTMNRFTDRKEDIVNNPRRFHYLDSYGKATLTIAAGLYLFSLFLLFQSKLSTFLVALLPLFIAILYSIFRLKRVFLLKNISVSLGILCAVFIVLVHFDDVTVYSLVLALFFLLGFLINTIVYDIKDIEGDLKYNINTLPVQYGLEKTKIVCYMLLFASVLLVPVLISFNPTSYLLLFYSCYIGLYITFADNPDKLPPWYYGIFVDGEYLLLGACCGIALIMNMLL
jgi:4-hydroxybenzoate polyprenyltransferase